MSCFEKDSFVKKQPPLVHRVLMGALMAGSLCLPAHADNQMGYRLLSDQDAQNLPRNHGALGMAIEAAQRITDGGMTFDLIRVKQVRSGSPGEQAGFHPGDEIIAVNGEVFSSLATFAQYVGSVQPGSQINVDYIPAGGGPQQAQRIAVTVGMAGQAAQAAPQADQSNQPQTGLSTGTKVAIGMGAVALFGCYELGCFSHHHHAAVPQSGQAPGSVPIQTSPPQN
jgi:membrane-associated protease RseP (regulator of RpoE activity)